MHCWINVNPWKAVQLWLWHLHYKRTEPTPLVGWVHGPCRWQQLHCGTCCCCGSADRVPSWDRPPSANRFHGYDRRFIKGHCLRKEKNPSPWARLAQFLSCDEFQLNTFSPILTTDEQTPEQKGNDAADALANKYRLEGESVGPVPYIVSTEEPLILQFQGSNVQGDPRKFLKQLEKERMTSGGLKAKTNKQHGLSSTQHKFLNKQS